MVGLRGLWKTDLYKKSRVSDRESSDSSDSSNSSDDSDSSDSSDSNDSSDSSDSSDQKTFSANNFFQQKKKNLIMINLKNSSCNETQKLKLSFRLFHLLALWGITGMTWQTNILFYFQVS